MNQDSRWENIGKMNQDSRWEKEKINIGYVLLIC